VARQDSSSSDTAKLQVRVDAVTERMVKQLVEVGRFGTTDSEVCCNILRMWFWDNQEKLKQNGVFITPAKSPTPSDH
jgi:hypothetical protein